MTAANPAACLIIVANRTGTFADAYDNFSDTACWFFGDLQSSTVSVIIATYDEIRLEQFNDASVTTDVSYASICAGSIYLMGPLAIGDHMRLHHAVPEDSALLVHRLTSMGALPMPGSGPTPARPDTRGGLNALYRDTGPARGRSQLNRD